MRQANVPAAAVEAVETSFALPPASGAQGGTGGGRISLHAGGDRLLGELAEENQEDSLSRVTGLASGPRPRRCSFLATVTFPRETCASRHPDGMPRETPGR